jgi:hypothetical protein
MSSQRVSTRAQARAEGQQPEQPPALPAKADVRAKSASRKGKAAATAAVSNGSEPLESAVDAPPSDAAVAMQQQVAALLQTVQQQQQELQALRASPQPSPLASPQSSPQQPQRRLGSASAQSAAPSPAVDAAAATQSSRFARKEPRAQDLREYDGASGAKLDDWLDELDAAVDFFCLNDSEAVAFGVLRLRGAARQWWKGLGADGKAAVSSAASLGKALRARFQPVTAARAARAQLDKLMQGPRATSDYIADFQRLHALLPDMSEADALHAFERGLRRDIALELRIQRVTKVADGIALAAHVDGSAAAAAASSSSHGRGAAAAAAQMEIDDGDGAPLSALDARMDRLERTVLNAIQGGGAGSMHGLGAKTQTQRGYLGERRGRRGGFGARGGRGGGRGGFRGGAPLAIPGVPAEVVEQRRAAGQCFRCGDGNHRSMECPNAPSASPLSN